MADKPRKGLFDHLYNPSISDLERDEHQGEERDVIYLDDADNTARAVYNDLLALPSMKNVDHFDYCDIKASDLAWYNPEDVLCSCDAEGINRHLNKQRKELAEYFGIKEE